MEKEKISVLIGQHKRLVYEADPMNEHDIEFARMIRETATTKPQTLQDFFIRLNELQKKQTDTNARDTDQKAT